MSIRRVSLGLGAGAVLATLCLLGQQARLSGQERAVPVQGTPSAGAADEANFYRATDVIGMAMKDDEGQVVGKITDIVIDGTTEQVQYLIVEDVEMLQAGHFLIVPWGVAELHYADAPDQRFVIVHAHRAHLLTAPTFAMNGFNFRRGGDWIVQVNTFFDIDNRDGRRGSARPELDKGRGRRNGDQNQGDDRRRSGKQNNAQPSQTPSDQPQAQPERRQRTTPQPKAKGAQPQQPQQPTQPETPAQPEQPAQPEKQPEKPEPTPQPSEQP